MCVRARAVSGAEWDYFRLCQSCLTNDRHNSRPPTPALTMAITPRTGGAGAGGDGEDRGGAQGAVCGLRGEEPGRAGAC